MAGEKTEKATPKRKQDERKKGNVFKSREAVMVGSLITVFYSFKFLSPLVVTTIDRCIREFLAMSAEVGQLSTSQVSKIFLSSCIFFAMAAMPLLLISSASSVVFSGAQTRFNVSFKAIQFKGDRLNPISGIKKMFSMEGFVELFKSILKILVLGYIIYNQCRDVLPTLPQLMDMSVPSAAAVTGGLIFSIVETVAMVFAFVALFDYIYQWWNYEKNLRMSKQEIKEEYKESEGDPQIKGKIREKRQAMARRRMMQQVPTADVVIRNPTHYAVAIRYDPDKHRAPVVVAKGKDHVALKIIEIAQQHDVPTTENRPLARGLFEGVELEQEIPDRFYQAVAEVLAFVYSLQKKEWK